MDLSLGVAMFQLLKTFSGRNELIITKDDIINLIISFTEDNVKYDTETIVYNLENNGIHLRYCFEAIPYNYSGITIYELCKSLEAFYPKFNKAILFHIAKSIDKYSAGIVTYKDMCDFLYNYSKKEYMSIELIIKHIAWILDIRRADTVNYLLGDTASTFLEYYQLLSI